MKHLIILFSFCAGLLQAGTVVTEVHGVSYEGFYTAEQEGLPLVVILHDWDGLTSYEMKRAVMLREQGYAVMAADLFGQGVRPTEVADKRQHTGELYQNREKNADPDCGRD